jgi:uncharacterized protein YprB with RNaseH-like and TPR domain
MVITSLSDRLRQVVSPRRVVEGGGSAVVPPPLQFDGHRAADVLAGQWLERADGGVIVVDRHYTPDRLHGRERVGSIVATVLGGRDAVRTLMRAWPGPQRAAAVLSGTTDAREPASAPPLPSDEPSHARFCFLDLETTGLAGGAGTQAFLVGCAIPEDDGLHVRQFLLPGFEHERAMLAVVADWISAQGTLVTFNGRTFDVPLIETRFLFHRLEFPLAGVPHLDMLHPARGLWKERPTVAGPPLDEESCKLSVLERHLAGLHRIGDVPGFEIPSRFYRFIRGGDAHGLEAVLEHNRIDLLSLALVMARALRLVERGPGSASHPRECLGLGRVFERAGRRSDAEACYAHAAALSSRVGREPDVRAEALWRLAVCRRRAGRPVEAAAAWQELVSLPGCPSILRREARQALAIHHEHRSRDLTTARTFVLDALAERPAARWREQAEYRLRRIERKLAVRQQGGLIAALEDCTTD